MTKAKEETTKTRPILDVESLSTNPHRINFIKLVAH